MVKNIVYFVVFVLMLLGIAIYFRIEFKYIMVQNGQSTLILNKLKKAEKDKTDAVHTKEINIAHVAEQNGVAFAADFLLYDKYLHKACAQECLKQMNYYKALDIILNQIIVKGLWVHEQNKTKDQVAYFILDREINIFKSGLLKLRKRLVDGYNALPSNETKFAALDTVKKIDEKIIEIEKAAAARK